MTVARAVISIVPSIAGPIPPTFAGAVFAGIPLVRKDQLMIEAPLAITVTRTNPSGTSTTTNESTIKPVTMRLLVRRQPAGSRRSGLPCGSATTAIRHPASAGRSAPRSRGQ